MPLTAPFLIQIQGNAQRPIHAIARSSIPLLLCLGGIWGSTTAFAQTSTGPSPAATAAPAKTPEPQKLADLPSAGPLWTELSASQQATLKPLAASWNSLDAPRKRKWIAMSRTYAQLSPDEQEKIQSRMVDWAALSQRERAVARLNYAETKKLQPTDRAADWEAYQALSPEEKKKLAAKGSAATPGGAALSPKPSSMDKLTPVPRTRHTLPDRSGGTNTVTPKIDNKTLLPLPVVAATRAPAIPASAPTN